MIDPSTAGTLALIRKICPHLSAEAQVEAAERFDRLATLLCRIIVRAASEPGASAQATLTDAAQAPTMNEPTAP